MIVRLICMLRGHEWTGCIDRTKSGNRQTFTYLCSRCHKLDRVSFLENQR